MKTGERFWQLIGLVFFILGTYGLIDLNDQIKEKNNQLDRQYQILIKEQKLIQNNNYWVKNLKAINLVQQAWLSYLPLEDSVAVAKAHLLNDMRVLAKNTGVINLSITASETDEDNKDTSVDNNTISLQNETSNFKKNEPESLPANVHLIKVKLTGNFDPTVFTKMLHALENNEKIISIERVSVRGPQMEVNLRYYWRNI
jgi:hypothetical protein